MSYNPYQPYYAWGSDRFANQNSAYIRPGVVDWRSPAPTAAIRATTRTTRAGRPPSRITSGSSSTTRTRRRGCGPTTSRRGRSSCMDGVEDGKGRGERFGERLTGDERPGCLLGDYGVYRSK
ncbi:uncharacterized protein PG986_006469 [Apiospora aurea]|uniref:Uncharacterized protein n=1 Tax=Apiospora aurea TaxID=335848 RepID=A0ABR1QKH7_9PEZI